MGIECQTPQCVFAAVVAELKGWNTAQTFQLERCVLADAYVRDGKRFIIFGLGWISVWQRKGGISCSSTTNTYTLLRACFWILLLSFFL
jgi:hypothetical protein